MIENAIVVLVDFQDKLLDLIPNSKCVVKSALLLAKLAELNNAPVIATKQVKLGEVIDEVKNAAGGKVIEKETFSCFGCREFVEAVESTGRKTLVITGVETHICILQTALDALERGYKVVIPIDAVASQLRVDYEAGLEFMEKAGAEISSSELIVYRELGTPRKSWFKKILDYVKARRRACIVG